MTKAEFFVQSYPKRSLNNYSEPYYGYPEKLIREMVVLAGSVDWKNTTVAVMDDFSLELVRYLHFKLNVPFEHISLLVSNYNLKKLCEIQFSIIGIQIYGLDDEMMFDLIIANPPYGKQCSVAKPIIKKILKNKIADKVITLTPPNIMQDEEILKKCKDFSIYRNVNFFQSIVQPSLLIADFSEKDINKYQIEDIVLTEKEKTLFEAIKKYNSNHEETIEYVDGSFLKPKWDKLIKDISVLTFPKHLETIKNQTLKESVNNLNVFVKTLWTPFDGVHFKDAYDLKYNLRNEYDLKWNEGGRPIDIFIFKNKEEKDNYKNWWYSCNQKRSTVKERIGLTNKFLDLVRDSGHGGTGYFSIYFPHLDWSHPWTDEEILKEIGLPENFLTE